MIDSQRDVERFLQRHGLEYDVTTHMLDLVSEVGELAKLLLRASEYGREPLSYGDQLSGELGDAFYSLLALATVLDVDAEDALQGALQKYERRLEEYGDPGSRDEPSLL